ncbi:MAG: type II secretion system F family protein [Phycisphaerae bacterium]|jgi:type II secretory pathway component PulF
MRFAYEAMRPDGSTVVDAVEAADRGEAVESLRTKGLMVLRLNEAAAAAAGAATGGRPGLSLYSSKITARDIVLFTRQLKMLLESGSPLVPALEAAAQQTQKPAMRNILKRLQERVEEGDSLSEAMDLEQDAFDPVFRSMVAAGEATATLPDVFGRLCTLAQQRMQTRKMVLGAMLYPLILTLLLVGVMGVLIFFVVPRFRTLFDSLKSPLPPTTKVLFDAAANLQTTWPYFVGGAVAAIATLVVCLRLRSTRQWIEEAMLRLPVIGNIASRLIFARVVRVWAAMLRCHVPLLDTIHQSRDAITNAAFLRLLSRIEETVSAGGRMAQAISDARLADPVMVSAIRTGEENGRLAEAADFVSDWMDEDNTHLVQQITRLTEPLLLAFMGVVVGFVAMSLFLPLFDLVTAAG